MTERTLRWLAAKTPSTRAIYRPEIERFESWLGRKPVSALAIEDYQARLLVDRGLSAATVARIIGTICSWASPIVREAVCRVRSKPINPVRPLAPAKIARLVAAPASLRDAALIACALAGMRVSEACAVRPEDCRWAPAFVAIGTGTRTLKLTGAAFTALRKLRDRDGDLYPFVFHSCHGQLLTRYVDELIKKAANRAGLQDRVTWQRLRASGRVLSI